jgi:hypothetical protein
MWGSRAARAVSRSPRRTTARPAVAPPMRREARLVQGRCAAHAPRTPGTRRRLRQGEAGDVPVPADSPKASAERSGPRNRRRRHQKRAAGGLPAAENSEVGGQALGLAKKDGKSLGIGYFGRPHTADSQGGCLTAVLLSCPPKTIRSWKDFVDPYTCRPRARLRPPAVTSRSGDPLAARVQTTQLILEKLHSWVAIPAPAFRKGRRCVAAVSLAVPAGDDPHLPDDLLHTSVTLEAPSSPERGAGTPVPVAPSGHFARNWCPPAGPKRRFRRTAQRVQPITCLPKSRRGRPRSAACRRDW